MNNSSLFETVLAATVHDMKNSLSLLLGELGGLGDKLAGDDEGTGAISTLRYETSRVNLLLMQLLTLYKMDHDQLVVNKVEMDVMEFLEDCIDAHKQCATGKNIKLQLICENDLIWFFDPDLIGIAINNAIGNSIRHAHHTVTISAQIQQQQLAFIIIDDGGGFPEKMLNCQANYINPVHYPTGSTGLGLFFATMVTKNHRNTAFSGSIKLDNEGINGGGRFQLLLP